MSEEDPLQEVYAVMDASVTAFNAGDLTGWQAGIHPSLHTFQGDHFTSLADFQGEASESQLAMSDDFKPIWREGVVEGDAACVWGRGRLVLPPRRGSPRRPRRVLVVLGEGGRHLEAAVLALHDAEAVPGITAGVGRDPAAGHGLDTGR